MIRYFDRFNDDASPMNEISESAARAADSYAIEVTGEGPRHFIIYVMGKPHWIAYPDTLPSQELTAILRARQFRIPTWVISPVEEAGDIKRYVVWSYNATGELENREERIVEPRKFTSIWYRPDGQLGGWMERYYDENGFQVEAREFNAETGRTTMHD